MAAWIAVILVQAFVHFAILAPRARRRSVLLSESVPVVVVSEEGVPDKADAPSMAPRLPTNKIEAIAVDSSKEDERSAFFGPFDYNKGTVDEGSDHAKLNDANDTYIKVNLSQVDYKERSNNCSPVLPSENRDSVSSSNSNFETSTEYMGSSVGNLKLCESTPAETPIVTPNMIEEEDPSFSYENFKQHQPRLSETITLSGRFAIDDDDEDDGWRYELLQKYYSTSKCSMMVNNFDVIRARLLVDDDGIDYDSASGANESRDEHVSPPVRGKQEKSSVLRRISNNTLHQSCGGNAPSMPRRIRGQPVAGRRLVAFDLGQKAIAQPLVSQ